MSTDWIWEDKTMSGKVNFYIPFKENQGMGALIKEFNESYPNIEVTLVPYNNNADGTSSFDNDNIIDALERELKAELVDKIWYPRARYTGDNTQTQDVYTAKLSATAITNNTIRFLHDPNYEVDFISGFAPYPVLEKGQTNYMSGVEAFSRAGIAQNCQDEEAAWAFLKWYSTYGVKYLAAAGHQPNWRGTEAGSGIEVIYGSEEEAKKWIDVESFTRVVGVSTKYSRPGQSRRGRY